MKPSPPFVSFCVALAVGLLCGSLSAADSGKVTPVGTFGAGDGHIAVIDLVYGNGSGVTPAGGRARGSQALLRFEGGGYFKSSSIGNLAGIEGGMEMGWDGVPKRTRRLFADYMADIGVAADFWLGFPVTLANLGDGKDDWLRWSFSPGMGGSLRCAYFYLKTAVAAKVGPGDAELAAVWWPDAVNIPFGNTNDALNSAALKLSYYYDRRLHFFVQYRRSQTVHSTPQATGDVNVFGGLNGAPGGGSFLHEVRSDADSVVTVGFGWTPFDAVAGDRK